MCAAPPLRQPLAYQSCSQVQEQEHQTLARLLTSPGGGTEEGNIIGMGLDEPHTSRLNGGFFISRYNIAGNIGSL